MLVEISAETPLFKLGNEGKIKCSLKAGDERAYQIEWYKNEVKLKTNHKFVLNENHLTIRGLVTNDSGKYECHIIMDQLKTNKSIFVNVIGKIQNSKIF